MDSYKEFRKTIFSKVALMESAERHLRRSSLTFGPFNYGDNSNKGWIVSLYDKVTKNRKYMNIIPKRSRSPVSLGNNYYKIHGKDLEDFIVTFIASMNRDSLFAIIDIIQAKLEEREK